MTTTLAPTSFRPRRSRVLVPAGALARLPGASPRAAGVRSRTPRRRRARPWATRSRRSRREAGTDITTAISQEPWKGESDAFVSGTYDYLVVNVDEEACAKLVFDKNESGSAYTIEKTYSC